MYQRACHATMSSESEANETKLNGAGSGLSYPGAEELDDLFFMGGRSVVIKNPTYAGSCPTYKKTTSNGLAVAFDGEQPTASRPASWNNSAPTFAIDEHSMPMYNTSHRIDLLRGDEAMDQQSLMSDFYRDMDASFADSELSSILSLPIPDPTAAIPGHWDGLHLPQPVRDSKDMTSAVPPLDDAWQKFLLEMGLMDTQNSL